MGERNISYSLTTCWTLVLLSCLCSLHTSVSLATRAVDADVQSVIDVLRLKIFQSQKQENDPVLPGQIPIVTKGTYRGVYKINLSGDETQAIIRRSIAVEDRNSFDTEWISIILLEAFLYGNTAPPPDTQLSLAIEYCTLCQDVRQPWNNSIIGFWPYQYNPVSERYDMQATFFLKILNTVSSLPFNSLTNRSLDAAEAFSIAAGTVEGFLDATGLGKYFDGFLQMLRTSPGDTSAYPDNDCTFVWLGLGSTLEMLAQDFPGPRNLWRNNNPNVTSAFDALKKYAYRPFSGDEVANTIDTRSYYVIRGFFDEAVQNGENLVLASAWITAIDEQDNLFVNDVDAVVSANVIFGLTASILSGLVSNSDVFEDSDLLQIYVNTTSLLTYLVKNDFVGRQDLIIPYYQHRYTLYVSLARSVSLLDSYEKYQPLPDAVMDDIYSMLRAVAEIEMTEDILSKAKRNNDSDADDDNDDVVYFDDFLGDDDITEDGKPLIRGEDRMFTTAMAANALMFTWLSFDNVTRESRWKAHTPAEVKDTVRGCVRWLVKNSLTGVYKPWNSFDTIRDKNVMVYPRFYPANFFAYYNGTPVMDVESVSGEEIALGVRGYIAPDVYKGMLEKLHFGMETPTVFESFNKPGWTGNLFESSQYFTYAVTLLAISRSTQVFEE